MEGEGIEMTKTIDFQQYRLRKMGQTGEANFICCPKCEGDEWAVVVISDGKAPFIYSLVCISETCLGDVFLPVNGGVIEHEVV
jgi:hypothetical protein